MSVKISSYFGRYRDQLLCDVPSKNFSDIFLPVMLNIFLILAQFNCMKIEVNLSKLSQVKTSINSGMPMYNLMAFIVYPFS